MERTVEAIYRICEDEALRDNLYEGGQKTAQSREWKNLEDDILKFYDMK